MSTIWLARTLAGISKDTPVARGSILSSLTGISRYVNNSRRLPRATSYTSIRRTTSKTWNETLPSPVIAIIGSGPAGFYTARHLQRHLPSPHIDIYDRLPIPFGLVRYGVAPDHPEVKKCIEDFEHVAQHPNTRFIGNVQLGENIQLKSLVHNYDVIVFAYGASKDRELGLENEGMLGVLSARAFVGWYNGLPEYRDLKPDLSRGENAVIIGQGNVALDCARILLADVEELKKTDITSHALKILQKSKIKHVSVVGRRGPMQAAFTIKEVRELINLPNISFKCVAEGLYPADLASLPRPKRRLMELLMKNRDQQAIDGHRSCTLRFCLAPTKLGCGGNTRNSSNASDNEGGLTSVEFTNTTLADPADPASAVRPTTQTTTLPATLLLRSIGYKAEALPGMQSLGIRFDERKGMLVHDGAGRLLSSPDSNSDSGLDTSTAALYCAGWVKRGPTGVIASTMTDAFQTAEAIIDDLKTGKIHLSSTSNSQSDSEQKKTGWLVVQSETKIEPQTENKTHAESATRAPNQRSKTSPMTHIDWKGWRRIDEMEKSRGKENGKPREKIVNINEMLQVARGDA